MDTARGIDVMNANGSGRHAVAAAGAAGPRWSPDGTRLVFGRSHCTPGVKGLCGAILGSVYSVGADGRGEQRLTGPIGGGPGSLEDGVPYDQSSGASWWPSGSRLFFFRQRNRAYVVNADGTCEQPFGPGDLQLDLPRWRPGAVPSLPPLRCVDLRARAAPTRTPIGLRGRARFDITIENDGNETATALRVSLSLSSPGGLRVTLRACRRGHVVVCRLAPLGAGRATHFAVSATRPKPPGVRLGVRAVASQRDSNPASNATDALVTVLPCDLVGTESADTIAGTARGDTICGLPGPDVIHAGPGHDRVDAGSGDDTIVPGPGRDLVAAWEGRDRIDARDGETDVIDCGPQRDVVHADRRDRLRRCEVGLRR